MKYRFLSTAHEELRRAAIYYDRKVLGLGMEFLDEIDQTVERILRNPLAWRKISENNRRCRTKRFPYSLIYSIANEEIVIVSVMNLHRGPDAWEGF